MQSLASAAFITIQNATYQSAYPFYLNNNHYERRQENKSRLKELFSPANKFSVTVLEMEKIR